MDTLGFLNLFYLDSDYVCLFFNPPFQKIRQRFAYVSEIKGKYLGFLRAANREANIYISVYPFLSRPRTEINVTSPLNRVFLDFDREPPYLKFIADYIPFCTINTSPGKYQCFLKFRAAVSKEMAKAISRGLSVKYGADHVFDLARVFRFPGFNNLKYPEKPMARVIQVNQQALYPGEDLPKYAEEPKPLPSINPDVSIRKRPLKYGYDHFLLDAPRKVNGDPDFSSADYSYCIYLFSRGFDDGEIRSALLSFSPNLIKRKGGGLENYLNKTLSRARQYQITHDSRIVAVG